MKATAVIPGLLYIRGRFEKDPDRLRGLSLLKIHRVMSFRPHSDEELARWIKEGKSGVVKHYHHIPLPDGKLTEEIIAKVQAAVAIILEDFEQKKRVLVHCNAGRNRSGMVAALAIAGHHQWSGKKALEWLRCMRPTAVANEYFAAYVESVPAPSGPTASHSLKTDQGRGWAGGFGALRPPVGQSPGKGS